jgi:hypothetical protein
MPEAITKATLKQYRYSPAATGLLEFADRTAPGDGERPSRSPESAEISTGLAMTASFWGLAHISWWSRRFVYVASLGYGSQGWICGISRWPGKAERMIVCSRTHSGGVTVPAPIARHARSEQPDPRPHRDRAPDHTSRADRRVGVRLSAGLRVVSRPGIVQRASGRSVYLCTGARGVNVRF